VNGAALVVAQVNGAAVVVGLIIWVVCGFAGYKIMQSKGQSAALGLILGLVLGLIGLIICLVFPRKN
jgi:hypothetical protein